MGIIRYQVAADVYRELIGALDELTSTVTAQAGTAEEPYDRGFVDGAITMIEAMTDGLKEAVTEIQPDDALW